MLPRIPAGRRQVVSVKGSSGWAFEMALRPGSELALFDKFSLAGFVQVGRRATVQLCQLC
jgi:hypothetical protein